MLVHADRTEDLFPLSRWATSECFSTAETQALREKERDILLEFISEFIHHLFLSLFPGHFWQWVGIQRWWTPYKLMPHGLWNNTSQFWNNQKFRPILCTISSTANSLRYWIPLSMVVHLPGWHNIVPVGIHFLHSWQELHLKGERFFHFL